MRGPQAFVGLLGVLALLLPATPQGAAPWQTPYPRFSVGVDAVALDVVVTDERGRFVRGLRQEDFSIFEDGTPQRIVLFTSESTPATVLVLLDSSASVRVNLREVQKAANRFIDRMPRGDAARVGFFHDRVVFGPRFTDNMKEHVAVINQMRPQRSTHLHDALLASFEELSTVPGRQALLLFTDGDDEGSEASMEDALGAARRSLASVYAVGLVGWSAAAGTDTNEELLTQLAAFTGGRAFFPTDEREMRTAFDTVAEELHRQYRIGYLPSTSQGAGNGWRDVEIRMTRRKDLVVRTRRGYYPSENPRP
jgi:Ca-activated chloride channel family protein